MQIPGYTINAAPPSTASSTATTELDKSIDNLRNEIAELKKVKDEFKSIEKAQGATQLKWSEIAATGLQGSKKFDFQSI